MIRRCSYIGTTREKVMGFRNFGSVPKGVLIGPVLFEAYIPAYSFEQGSHSPNPVWITQV